MTIIMMIIYSVKKLYRRIIIVTLRYICTDILVCMFLTFRVLSLDQSNLNLVLSLDHIYL